MFPSNPLRILKIGNGNGCLEWGSIPYVTPSCPTVVCRALIEQAAAAAPTVFAAWHWRGVSMAVVMMVIMGMVMVMSMMLLLPSPLL